MLSALLALMVLVVDWGHVQMAKSEIMSAATAAARAGVVDLSRGSAVARSSAIANALQNTVDGRPLILTSGDVSVGTWNPVTRVFTAGTTSPNAVQVSAVANTARGTAIPLTFGGTIGVSSCNISSTAIAMNSVDVQVDLASQFNWRALYSDGATFASNGGADHSGYATSATALGGVVTRGATTYTLGPSGANNAIRCTGQTIPLPAGDYKSIVLIVLQGYGPVTNTLTLNNNDSTTTVYAQSVSDWCAPRSSIVNENVCATLAYRNLYNGGRNNQVNYVLSYELPITSSAGAASITLPTSNLKILAIGLTPAAAITVR